VEIHSQFPASITEAVTLLSCNIKTPSTASKRWSWAGTRARRSEELPVGIFKAGGAVVVEIVKDLRLRFSMGLVGTDTFGDEEGIGEFLGD
jgi:hypothetical protein